MSRRNPMNERYGKHTAPQGKTRKSAASAKPKRAGGSGASGSSSSKPASSASKKKAPLIHPPTPEYRLWRRIWWVLLVGAIILSSGAWWLWKDAELRDYGNWVLIAGYAMIFAAIFVDFFKLRKMRTDYIQAQRKGKSAKPEKKAAGKATDGDGGKASGQSPDESTADDDKS